jgi:glyoxylase-like metal-dependent hydrolase (beta-lactamase superfamily II)
MYNAEVFTGEGFTLRAIETPGHTMNHLAFELAEEQTLFSGDHVMAWSTTSIAPPDGAMLPYMASLEKLLTYDHKTYWPGHGGPVEEPQRFVRGLLHHRRMREQAILNRLLAGDTKIETIVANIYKNLDPRLNKGASLSVLAHLEALCAETKATCDGSPTLDAMYRLP